MRIISWNCNRAYGKKSHAILAYKPDLLILQECSKADIENSDANFKQWVGANPQKGLGVLGFGDHKFRVADNYIDSIHWAIPIESDTINVLGMWAHKDAGQTYVMAVTNAIDHYDRLLKQPNTIFIGDMNNNVLWDSKTRKELQWNTFIENLKLRDKHSIWHETKGEEHGKESVHTLNWRYSHKDKYHIDFAFGSKDLITKANMHIGTAEDWLKHSDHMPIVVDIAT